MALNVAGSAGSTHSISIAPSSGILSGIGQIVNLPYSCTFTNGTAANQINLYHVKTYTLAAGVTGINLFDGSLLDPYGAACAFRKVKRFRVQPLTTTDAQTTILGYGTTTSNAWTGFLSNPGTITLQAASSVNNAWFDMECPNTTGWAVSTSNKLFQFDPGANTFNINVEIWGTDA